MLLYINYVDLDSDGFVGIKKKVLGQLAALKQNLGDVCYTNYAGRFVYLMDGKKELEKAIAITPIQYHTAVKQWINKYGIEYIYIRYNCPANRWFIQFLQWLKDEGKKSVIEIPTYPYEKEIRNQSDLVEDRYYRRRIKSLVERITIFGEELEVYGVHAIQLKNGIDLNDIPQRKPHSHDEIVLLTVSTLAWWHGYERLLIGLRNYYNSGGKKNIQFKIVGDGEEYSNYKHLIEANHLEDHVELMGIRRGRELDQLFDSSDIAVGSLGSYKKGIYKASAIKLAEYCARGIPFIHGENDNRFSGSEVFRLQVPNDPSPIDIEEIIQFYDQTVNYDGLHDEMRRFAESNLTWNVIMQPVIECFK